LNIVIVTLNKQNRGNTEGCESDKVLSAIEIDAQIQP